MTHPTTCQSADFFMLRSPGLPLDALAASVGTGPGFEPDASSPSGPEGARETWPEVLRGLIRREAVREAVALASPDLASRLEAWLEGSLDAGAARNVERALLKYLSRMSSRSTPFGLFAGVSRGTWVSASRLSVGPWLDCRKAVRLDWGVLENLVTELERAPEVRSLLPYRPNSSLYERGGWYRYLECRDQPGGSGRTYHLEAVEATPHLDFVLERAREGASLRELTMALAGRMEVGPEDARAFLEQLVAAQLLRGDLHPPLTCADPLGRVIAALQAEPLLAPRAEPLILLARELGALQGAPLGAHPQGYRHLTTTLATFGIPPGTRDVLQVDLFRPAPGLGLSQVVRRALEEGAETLRRLTPPPSEGPLNRFRAAFLERYGTRWMPMMEVLDEESGLGFDGGEVLDSPLLEGLPFHGPPLARPFSSRDQFLLKQVQRWQDSRAWVLDDADWAALANPDPRAFPTSFAVLASLEAASPAALDRGEFRFWMEHHSGPTAARWLGRFATGDPELREALQNLLRREESRHPDAVFAEVVHVPEGRMGNVLARPSLREYEIPFLATAGVPQEKTILPSELLVSVRGERILLRSARLGREVIPRLSSAHNFARGPAVYRFLAHLQDQDGRPGGWSWGALAEQPFLPRVTRGRHVLSRARWRIEARELKAALDGSAGDVWGAFQSLREGRELPRQVLLSDADNFLLVDLDQAPWVEVLHHLVANRPAFLLTECFPEPGQALVTSAEGGFGHELVIPLEGLAPSQPEAGPLPPADQATVTRAYSPGSEWLYLKLYCGPASADRLLVELEPLLKASRAAGLWDRWHFLRYRDPDHHLRLRFHGQPSQLLSDLLPQVHQRLEEGLAQGLLWKWQVDTFEPEWERYGGALGFALAEAWFSEDSHEVLGRLSEGQSLEQRWRAGLWDTDAIWCALGLSVRARMELAKASREGFRKEFRDPGAGAVQIGLKFRTLRRELEEGWRADRETSAFQASGGLARIRQACGQGLIQTDLASLAGSLAHMHLNRVLRRDQRENEWVLMEFLTRLYESRLARGQDS